MGIVYDYQTFTRQDYGGISRYICEVAGSAAEFFNPCESESTTNALEKVLYSRALAEILVKIATQRIKLFSWEVCVEQTRQVPENVIASGNPCRVIKSLDVIVASF